MESCSSTWFLVNISMCAVWCILCEAECPGGLRKLPDSKGQKNMGLTYQAPRSLSLSPRPPPSLLSSPPSSLLSAALSDAPVPIHFWVMSIHFSSQPLSWKWDFSSPWTQSICLHKVFLSPSHNDASENKLLGAPHCAPWTSCSRHGLDMLPRASGHVTLRSGARSQKSSSWKNTCGWNRNEEILQVEKKIDQIWMLKKENSRSHKICWGGKETSEEVRGDRGGRGIKEGVAEDKENALVCLYCWRKKTLK